MANFYRFGLIKNVINNRTTEPLVEEIDSWFRKYPKMMCYHPHFKI